MSRASRGRWFAVFIALGAIGLAALVSRVDAHEMTMAEMQLREVAPGDFLWQWTANEKGRDELVPHWPESCRADANMLRCGSAGLSGTLSIDGVGQGYSAALLKVFWLDGQTRVFTLTASQPVVHLYGGADDSRGLAEIASAYAVLGIEHILTGVDHLAFVLSLLFLVGFRRRLLWTVTAFTAAHSITLMLAATGLLVLRPPPVEATIALSIVLVAGEALHRRDTWSRRWPSAVAFLFGLVHGLGFAGALKEIGLPQAHLSIALVTFNLGVEAGQLLTLGCAWLVWRATSRWPALERMRTGVLYAIGTIAAYWSWSRIAAIVG